MTRAMRDITSKFTGRKKMDVQPTLGRLEAIQDISIAGFTSQELLECKTEVVWQHRAFCKSPEELEYVRQDAAEALRRHLYGDVEEAFLQVLDSLYSRDFETSIAKVRSAMELLREV